MKTIIIEVDDDAKVTVKGQGFKGKSCEKPIAELIDAMGGTVTKSCKLPEWYQQSTQKQTIGGQ